MSDDGWAGHCRDREGQRIEMSEENWGRFMERLTAASRMVGEREREWREDVDRRLAELERRLAETEGQ